MLLFGKEPQKHLTESFIICSHFLGNSGREVVATRDCTGSLFQQYKECMTFLLTQLNMRFTIEGMNPREQELEVPEEALREVVINALVHRSYHISAPTKIAIYGDRIEVFSPGNFPGPIQIDHLTIGITYIRNIIIARAFREIGLMEKLGSGFQTLFRCYEEAGLPTPIIHEGGGFVKCILPRPVGKTLFQEYQDPLIKLFNTHLEVKIVDVMKALAISRATATRRLQVLLDQGIVERVGLGPSTRYVRVKN
jgi:ATP-dependent DNA helicase RecG